jgi:TPP-dependent pyruvate/acetoin dehydrogenase alpha subunit
VCENNFYAMSTPITQSFKVPEVAQRAVAYGIPGVTVDGNDYFAVREAMRLAVERARAGEGPTLVECETYRIFGHSKSDKCEYRPDAEEEAWFARDPLCLMSERLMRDFGVTEAQVDTIYAEVQADVEEAVRFAQGSPEPDPATVAEGLFAQVR